MYLLLLLAQDLPTELQVCPHPQTHRVGVFWGPTPGGMAVSQVKILLQDSHLSVSSDATDYALEPDNFLHTTFHQFMSWKLNEITTSSPSPPPSVTASDPRAPLLTPSCSTQLLNFKRGIKRDISANPILKDEKYYESFKRSVLVTARANDCEEILQPTLRPRGDADRLELFRLKMILCIVFSTNAYLVTWVRPLSENALTI